MGISFLFERRMACDETGHGRWRGTDAFLGECGSLGISFSFERRMTCDDTEHRRWRGTDAFGESVGCWVF